NTEKSYINIHNLSTNTAYSDYGVSIVKAGVLFSSTRPSENIKKNKLYKWNQQPFLNVYVAKVTLIENDFNVKVLDLYEPEKLNNINTRYHEASAIVTKDGSTMYFTRDNYDGKKLRSDKKRTTHLKIYKASLSGNQWINVQELPFNNNDFSSGQPTLSVDEKTLYFVSDMPGGYGATDLYKVAILENDTYGKPENLGANINTEGREMFPYISANNVLYFSSDGHIGLGALDVFESSISSNGFSNPSNLGVPINSKRDDFSYVIDQNQTKGYFSSNRKGGKGDDDIYSFVIYECEEAITGIVTDANTKEVLPNTNVKLVDRDGKIIGRTTTNDQGGYSFGMVNCEKEYTVVAEREFYKPDLKKLKTLAVHKAVIQADLELIPLVVQGQIVINPIFFDFDKWNIREDAEYELEHIVTVMTANPTMVIKIESHTDSRGTKDYNRKLSDRRAKSTRDYIISRGIEANRIESAIGYGEDQLLNHCDDANATKCTKAEHQENRRSYFYIVTPTKK
ncbi:MAG: OmpA family protein, partial [Flavobacteriaceae bacterium]|nr:OmpA family protein [Flavobacteriaceae bacterium]